MASIVIYRLIPLAMAASFILSLNSAASGQTKVVKAATGLSASELAVVKGDVGIAVLDISGKRRFGLNQDKPFPMQSVCKLPISIAVLRQVDAGKLAIDQKITVRKSDVIPFHSPIKESIKGKESQFTIANLITRAIRDSDNTACDLLIALLGGPGAVTSSLKDCGIEGVRVDRPEGKLQPESLQIARFLKDPQDTATPLGTVTLLEKLYNGGLLSKASTEVLLEDLFKCTTGTQRIKAGLPTGWKLAHKTGTGADVAGQNTATNDVGIAVGPAGETIYIAVFVKGARSSIQVREALMAKIAAKAVSHSLD